MSQTYIPSAIREQVRLRAGWRCEYCLLAEEHAHFSHEADHIIAEKHGGETTLDNLAWSCFDCNRFKGSDLTSVDPVTGDIVVLFNPRPQVWGQHFQVSEAEIAPLTATGRATVRLLKLNLFGRIEVRKTLILAGRYP